MRKQNQKLVIEQLDNTLKQFGILRSVSVPQKGWIRAIRNALNMSGRQLAQRLNLSDRSSVTLLEQNEINGAATIRTMKNAAQALNCVFVYGFIPLTSLKDTIKKQAESLARKRIEKTSHTMLLEQQQISKDEEKKLYYDAINELLDNLPKSLWD
ncbi:MAG: mobile mystery protein A [Candidatus Aadella gelida]|nr:mobile mystery protein A [Candidatus Aadella gelida]